MSDKISGSQQENLLALLVWSDTAFQLIRDAVAPNLFTTDVYRDIISRIFEFIDTYHKPPKDHFPDLLEDAIEEDGASSELYQQVVEAVFRVKDNLNEEYILSQLEKFVRLQKLKLGMIRASEAMQQDDHEGAAVELEKALKDRLSLFSPGITPLQGLERLRRREGLREPLSLGIPELDKHGIGPARKELHNFIGVRKGGKTTWLIHLAKRALMARQKVSYITLETSQDLIAARTLQSMFSLRLTEGERLAVTRFKKDELGRIAAFEKERLVRPSLSTTEGLKFAAKKADKSPIRNMVIKEFPTRSLDINGLKAYLDSLERLGNFTPDLLLVDYPGLMKVSSQNYRIELGNLAADLRGIAVDRNMAVAMVSQSNREGAKAGTTSGIHVAEDWSQNATADVVLAYSQTAAEYELGLARISIDASRISRQHVNVMISQAYDIGQFCLDSAPMMSSYWNSLKEFSGKDVEPTSEENES